MAAKVTNTKNKKPKLTKSAKSQKNPNQIHTDDIAEHAYYLWRERGGDAMQNWFTAEQQLKQATKEQTQRS